MLPEGLGNTSELFSQHGAGLSSSGGGIIPKTWKWNYDMSVTYLNVTLNIFYIIVQLQKRGCHDGAVTCLKYNFRFINIYLSYKQLL